MVMEKFRDIYKGQTVWIVGKGPSLQYLTKKHIGLGPVITINESIIKIEEIDLPNPIYSMQKDGGDRRRYQGVCPLILKPDCDYTPNCGDKCGGMYRPKKGATLLVHKHESLYCFPDYSPRYVFDWQELGFRCNQFSQIIAVKIGSWMGCAKFNFISFDAHTNGCLGSYVPGIGVTHTDPGFINHTRKIRRHIKHLNHKWITPKKGDVK